MDLWAEMSIRSVWRLSKKVGVVGGNEGKKGVEI